MNDRGRLQTRKHEKQAKEEKRKFDVQNRFNQQINRSKS